MTNTKRLLSIFLSLIMIFGNILNVSAAVINNDNENPIEPCYVNISSCAVNLSISGIKAKCSANVQSGSSMNLKIKMELQKKKSSGYETVETWTSSKTGTFLTMSESRNINIFSDYRLKVTFTAGSEIVTVYKYPS